MPKNRLKSVFLGFPPLPPLRGEEKGGKVPFCLKMALLMGNGTTAKTVANFSDGVTVRTRASILMNIVLGDTI